MTTKRTPIRIMPMKSKKKVIWDLPIYPENRRVNKHLCARKLKAPTSNKTKRGKQSRVTKSTTIESELGSVLRNFLGL